MLAALAFLPGRGDAAFSLHRLVTERADPQLVNAWGLAASATGPWWVANEARGSSTIYSGSGRKQALTVSVPGGPTGVVYNGGPGFIVHAGRASGPARFLYACEDGTHPRLVAERPARLVEERRRRGRRDRVRDDLPRRRNRRRPSVRDRLPQRARARLRLEVAARSRRGRIQGSRRSVPATRRSASRRSAATCSSPTRARRR